MCIQNAEKPIESSYMKNFTLNAMSSESLEKLLQSENELMRKMAAKILSQRKVIVEADGFGKRSNLPRLDSHQHVIL